MTERLRPLRVVAIALALSLGVGAVALARGLPKGQASLEIAGELDHGVGNITFTRNNDIVFSFHPMMDFNVRVARLGADHRSWTPFPNAEWQNCRDANGHPKPADSCLNWVLGLHAEPNSPDGIVWIIDGGMNDPVMTPKLVAWNIRQNRLERVIMLPPPATIHESQVQDFVIDASRKVMVIADEAIGLDSGMVGSKAALIVVDLVTGTARRVLQGDASVIPDQNLPVIIDRGLPTERALKGFFVGVDGIALDQKNEWVYYLPISSKSVFRVRMADLANPRLTDAQLSARVQLYATKPGENAGISIDRNNNLYLTDPGNRTIGIISGRTRKYSTYVTDPKLITPDGVSYSPDGYMYTAANQLVLSAAVNNGVGTNKPPYYIFRFRPEAPGNPGY